MNYLHWNTREIARLRELYPTATVEELEREFAPRKIGAIRSCARKNKIRKTRDWMAIAQRYQPSIIFWSAT